jgi:hypothetical protein
MLLFQLRKSSILKRRNEIFSVIGPIYLDMSDFICSPCELEVVVRWLHHVIATLRSNRNAWQPVTPSIFQLV